MGRASSAKKVARAARAGGTAKRERPKLAFPLAVFVIIVLGTSLVIFARQSREPASAAPPSYLNSDHWHAAYGIYVCDKFLPPLTDVGEDRDGIHTHGDGIMHIHPFAASSSGDRARFSVFGKQTGVTFSNNGFTMPDGTTYEDGYDCNGQPAKVSVFKWYPDQPDRPGDVYDSNFANINFDTDRAAYTIAVVPEGVTPPLPESVPTLDNLSDVGSTAGAGAAGQTIPTDLSTLTVPPGASTESTVAGDTPVTDASTDASTTPTTAAAAPDASTP